jgi:beta-N-acetylhexosaminidase
VASEATIGRGGAAAARRWARGIAGTLAAAGINLNFAPVVDLDSNPRNPAIGALGRSFSADAGVVIRMASIEIRAHRAAGVLTTLKHFPGIGGATESTDRGIVDVTGIWTEDDQSAFLGLIAPGLADLVMVGHVIDRDIDPALPASLSKLHVTTSLRQVDGWNGVTVTDDLQAPAITDQFGTDEAILLALEAGNDLLLFANQQTYDDTIVDRVVQTVVGAVASGRLTEERIAESATRVTALFAGR